MWEAAERTPLHPKALTLDGIVVGREVIVYNIHGTMRRRGRVLAKPFEAQGPAGSTTLRVTLELEDGKQESLFLTDCGVIQNWMGQWNRHNFTIDAGDERDLPEPVPDDRPLP